MLFQEISIIIHEFMLDAIIYVWLLMKNSSLLFTVIKKHELDDLFKKKKIHFYSVSLRYGNRKETKYRYLKYLYRISKMFYQYIKKKNLLFHILPTY